MLPGALYMKTPRVNLEPMTYEQFIHVLLPRVFASAHYHTPVSRIQPVWAKDSRTHVVKVIRHDELQNAGRNNSRLLVDVKVPLGGLVGLVMREPIILQQNVSFCSFHAMRARTSTYASAVKRVSIVFFNIVWFCCPHEAHSTSEPQPGLLDLR
jgi:hypothetical protein